MTSELIKKLIEKKYNHENGQYIVFDELRNGTGYGKIVTGSIDVFVLNTYPSKQFQRMAFEIKVSRSDFLREIKNPNKRRFAMAMSNEFYFVAPKGLLKNSDIPLNCGLMEVITYKENHHIKTVVPAIWRDNMPPSWSFVASICRRVKLRK